MVWLNRGGPLGSSRRQSACVLIEKTFLEGFSPKHLAEKICVLMHDKHVEKRDFEDPSECRSSLSMPMQMFRRTRAGVPRRDINDYQPAVMVE